MSAPVAQSQFTTSHSQSHRETAAMWRGAALDHFAEIEAITLSWLITLDAAGTLGIAPGDFVAWNRFKRLATILADARFSPFNGKVLLLLDALEGEHDLRIALAWAHESLGHRHHAALERFG